MNYARLNRVFCGSFIKKEKIYACCCNEMPTKQCGSAGQKIFGILLFLLSFFNLQVINAMQASGYWAPPATIIPSTYYGSNPQIAFDKNKNAIAVWGQLDFVYYSRYDGKTASCSPAEVIPGQVAARSKPTNCF